MANEEHLAILKQGVKAWNAWRQNHPETRPDLSGANLEGMFLSLADLSGVDLYGAYLREVDLRWTDLREADLREADLSEADLSETIFSKADLGWSELGRAVLRRAVLRGVILNEADLSEVDLSEADLSEADLSGANLSRTTLTGATFNKADLRWATLIGANFRSAVLTGTDFNEADLGSTSFSDVDLSTCRGLETVRHRGPSTIGIDTLYRSNGQISEMFLRGCGIPDVMIEYLPSLLGARDLIQYYSCFISYSSKDDDFARRLHGRMQQEHLRVWFAPEDMKGGKKIIEQLDQAIQLHDRLLLVLSEESIRSTWVTTEIKRARATERREQRQKLFPIRLVDMDTLKAWQCFDSDTGEDLAAVIREYHIPDFSHWKDHDAFERAFANLLRDLHAAEG